MATTLNRYNHTQKLKENGEINYANLKFMLRSGSTFTATHTVVSDLAGSEVSGNGWTAGGEALANAAVTIVETDGAMVDADDIAVTASGGDIGPVDSAVIIDDTDVDPQVLWHYAFSPALTAGDGTEFQVNINASGISRTT